MSKHPGLSNFASKQHKGSKQEPKTEELKTGKAMDWGGGSFTLSVVFKVYLYTIMINHRLSIYTFMKYSLLSLKLLALVLNSLDTLSNIRIKAFMLVF